MATLSDRVKALAQAIGVDIKEIKIAQDSVTITDQNNGAPLKIWTGTQSEYDAVTTKDSGTLYVVKA